MEQEERNHQIQLVPFCVINAHDNTESQDYCYPTEIANSQAVKCREVSPTLYILRVPKSKFNKNPKFLCQRGFI